MSEGGGSSLVFCFFWPVREVQPWRVIRCFRRADFLDLRERYRIYRPAIMIVGVHLCKYNHLAAGDHPSLVPRPATPWMLRFERTTC